MRWQLIYLQYKTVKRIRKKFARNATVVVSSSGKSSVLGYMIIKIMCLSVADSSSSDWWFRSGERKTFHNNPSLANLYSNNLEWASQLKKYHPVNADGHCYASNEHYQVNVPTVCDCDEQRWITEVMDNWEKTEIRTWVFSAMKSCWCWCTGTKWAFWVAGFFSHGKIKIKNEYFCKW